MKRKCNIQRHTMSWNKFSRLYIGTEKTMKMKPILALPVMHFGQVHMTCHGVHSNMKLAQKAKNMSLNVKTYIPCRNCHCQNEAKCITCQSSDRRSWNYSILALIISAVEEQFYQLRAKQKVWIMLKCSCCCALKLCLECYQCKWWNLKLQWL
jgi:hypothetical protein